MSASPQLRSSAVLKAAPRPTHRRMYAALTLVLVIGAAGWFLSIRMERIDVTVASPLRRDIETTISSSGVVAPVNDYPVRANFSGMVEKLYVHVGQRVHAGQMLVRMKDQYAVPRLDSARAALQESESNLENAEQNGTQDDHIGYNADLVRAQMERNDAAAGLVTLQKLERRGSVSDSELQNGVRRLQLADAALKTLRERMVHRYSPAEIASLTAKVRADRDSLAAERISWANANISTPVAGTVYSIPVLPYDFVPGGGELMHVADLDHFQVRSDFLEPDIGLLHSGQPVTIQWEGAPGKSWSGKVVTPPVSVDRNGPLSTGHCIIALTSPLDNLPINSSVTVVVQTQKHADVLTLPRGAVYGGGTDHFVYRVVHDRLRKTPVQTGIFSAMAVEIVGGLTERDVVAARTAGGPPLKSNARVTVVENHSS